MAALPSARPDRSGLFNPRTAPFASDAARASVLADTAVWALIEEAELTPKPGLVDSRGGGTHPDLSLKIMRRSACSLRPSFEITARTACGRAPDRALREALALIGRSAEHTMMAATGGANAHRGAIWALGLLIAAMAMAPFSSLDELGERVAQLARLPDRFRPLAPSHGQVAAARFGVTGARGEAQAGFPHALKVCLPTLRAGRARGLIEGHARLDALLAVMAVLDDTCLLHRGGRIALEAAQSGARAVLDVGGISTGAGADALHRLEASLLALNASPGGAADLLAAALFVDAVQAPASSEVRRRRGLEG